MFVRPDLSVADETAWLELEGRKPVPTRKRGSPERTIQRSVLAWVRQVCPGSIVAAITNEERGAGRTALQRARFGAARKRSGVVSGFPDLVIVLPSARVVWLEMKAPNGALSEAQQDVHARLRALGHHVGVATSIETARRVMLDAGVHLAEAADQPAPEAKVRMVKARHGKRRLLIPADKVPEIGQ